ncbi:hypothetical protein PVAND_000530 [Polypedilum vanderplanki]|uniref:Peptidase S1 domain-containing protein n=1 Tax=Polypedilum vanderplanki TaxID=319348 RepID=A0A9J6BKE3_POLVA|nr:hypothetical protein PVAND_000530 [Polypedilum vanderplanki]
MILKVLQIILFFNIFLTIHGNSNKESSEEATGLMYGGKNFKRGSFPWMVAIFAKLESDDFEYSAGGSIISFKSILTVAHCIYLKDSNKPLDKSKFKIYAGVHDLNDANVAGSVEMQPYEIHVHEKWDPYQVSYDYDIAIMVLEKRLEFTEFIKPIKITHTNKNIKDYLKGIVIGYGQSENAAYENIPKKISIPIVSNEECSRFPRLMAISSARMFCAGKIDGVTGPCLGDSGHGFFVKIDQEYYLRGLVSATLTKKKDGTCNLNKYALYTDVSKYIEWIKMNAPEFLNDFIVISLTITKGTTIHFCENTKEIEINDETFRRLECNDEKIEILTKFDMDLQQKLKLLIKTAYKQKNNGSQMNILNSPHSLSEQNIYNENIGVIDADTHLNSNSESTQIIDCNDNVQTKNFDAYYQINKLSFNNTQINKCPIGCSGKALQHNFRCEGCTQKNIGFSQIIQNHFKCFDENYLQVNIVISPANIEQNLIQSTNHMQNSKFIFVQENTVLSNNVKITQNIYPSYAKAIQINKFFDGNDEMNIYFDIKSTPYSVQFEIKYGGSNGKSIVNNYT